MEIRERENAKRISTYKEVKKKQNHLRKDD